MVWRAPYIRLRQHPLAIAAYVVIMLLGVFFISRVLYSPSLDHALSRGLRISWEVEMLAGGALALVSSLSPRRFFPESLIAEATGTFVSACGLGTYGAAVITAMGWSSPTWFLVAALAVGCLARTVQALWRDRPEAVLIDQARELLASA